MSLPRYPGRDVTKLMTFDVFPGNHPNIDLGPVVRSLLRERESVRERERERPGRDWVQLEREEAHPHRVFWLPRRARI